MSRINHQSSDEVSRAQIASSDGHRGPRRPSMNFQALQTPRIPNIVIEHARRENGQAWTEERTDRQARPDRERRVSIQTHEQHENDHSRVRGHHNHGSQQARLTRESLQYHDYQYHNHHHNHHRHHHNSDTSRRRDFRGVSSATTRDSLDAEEQRYVVPALPMPIAVICCILNFLVPGLGSMTAGLCVLCCGDTDDMTINDKCGSCCTVFGIGLLQLVLVACFLVGWIWSCIWGITFIGMSATYYDNGSDEYMDDDDEYYHQQPSNNPVYRTRGRQRHSSRLPTPQVVTDQPYPGVNYADMQRERRSRPTASRRTRSRISLTPSNLIYPMRAPSNIAYNSPPPPYHESPPPAYTTQSRTVLPSVVEN